MSLPRLLKPASLAITRVARAQRHIPQQPARVTPLRSMPSIPFFSSFFSSTPASNNMSYPDQRTDAEWRAVLSPGKSGPCVPCPHLIAHSPPRIPSTHTTLSSHIPLTPHTAQSNSASSAKRAPRPPAPATTTSTTPPPAPTPAPAAPRRCTRPRRSSTRTAGGPPTSRRSPAR